MDKLKEGVLWLTFKRKPKGDSLLLFARWPLHSHFGVCDLTHGEAYFYRRPLFSVRKLLQLTQAIGASKPSYTGANVAVACSCCQSKVVSDFWWHNVWQGNVMTPGKSTTLYQQFEAWIDT